MPSLIRALGIGALLALAGGDARADEEAAHATWDASLRAGYGTVYTDGLSYLGPGIGAAIGWRPTQRLRLEVTALTSAGTRERARNDTLDYRASYTSTHATIGIGYDVGWRAIVVRPTLRAGARVVDGRADVGSASAARVTLYPIVGPSLAVGARLGLVEAGVDVEGFLLPTWIGSPTLGVYAFAGVAL